MRGTLAQPTRVRDPRGTLGTLARRPLPVGLLPALREALEESTIPQRVEVVDLSPTSADFAAAVKGQGIKWSD